MPFLIFTVCGIRYRKRPPTVRNEHSVRKTAFSGTRRIFRSIRCKKQASVVRDAFSDARRAQNRPLGYGRDIRYRKPHPTVRNEATGYDYCVAGYGWKMRPLPTTRRTTTPRTPTPSNSPNPINSLNPQKPPKPHKSTPTPYSPP